MKVLAFLTDGFETVEALAVIDILRRANIGVDTVSITGNKSVKSAQNIIVEADKLIEDINCNDEDVCFLPGGPGHKMAVRMKLQRLRIRRKFLYLVQVQ